LDLNRKPIGRELHADLYNAVFFDALVRGSVDQRHADDNHSTEVNGCYCFGRDSYECSGVEWVEHHCIVEFDNRGHPLSRTKIKGDRMEAFTDFLFEGFNMGTVLEALMILVMAAVLANRGVKKTFKTINESLSQMVKSVDGIKDEMKEVRNSVVELSEAMRSVEQSHEARIVKIEKEVEKLKGESQGEL